MRKVVFFIDGWFMRKRIYRLKTFYYCGPEIRKYCMRHLHENDYLYRIFYYDTMPLDKKGHNPLTSRAIDFSKTPVAQQQLALFESIKNTPNMALRLGETVWRNKAWILSQDRLKALLGKKSDVSELIESDVKPEIMQKGVDMKLGLDIALIAIKKLADLLVIITGDEDVVPALKLARKEGMQVCLDSLDKPVRPGLREHVDFFTTKVGKYKKSP